MTASLLSKDEEEQIIQYKGEPHYNWPHEGRCDKCRYFFPDEKQKDPFRISGDCRSIAHQTERGHIHRRTGWDKTSADLSQEPAPQPKLF